jgi:hypothetical protein
VVDILKITSPIMIKNRVNNNPGKLPPDAVFDLNDPIPVIKESDKTQTDKKGFSEQKFFSDLSKAIFEPLRNPTGLQADCLQQLMALVKHFGVSRGIVPENLIDGLFVNPQDLLEVLIAKDQGVTVFKGEVFESLFILAGMTAQPEIKEAIAFILKYFDCYVNRENSFKAILSQSNHLVKQLSKEDGKLLEQQNALLYQLSQKPEGDQKEALRFLKNEYVPLLSNLVRKYRGNERIRNSVMAIIHQVIRFDKGDPVCLDEAVSRFGDLLKPMTELTEQDVEEMKALLFQKAKEAKAEAKVGNKEFDIASLISKTLEKSAPDSMNKAAQNLLFHLVQNENPILPFLHFVIPLRFMGEEIFGEFLIDKDCKERKGKAKEAQNIFFTIQSDKFGTFEVDLLARDRNIDLDIKCPGGLVDVLKNIKLKLRDIIEEQGYRLTNYQVEIYQESLSILQRFPKSSFRKAGIDVKI